MTAKVWSDEMLASMRLRGDDWGDALIKRIVDEGNQAGKNGNKLLADLYQKIVSIADGIPDDLHPDIKTFFLTEDRPAWAESSMLQVGEDVYSRHGLTIGLILLCASLPACYADAPGVNVLYISQQLTKFPRRRIVQTMRFLLDVMVPGGLVGNGHGAITAKKVRMLHAMNRYILRQDPSTRWDEAAWGVPLNQEDLALTLMTFSVVVIDCLDKLKDTIDPQRAEDYFRTWNYIGYLMGVMPELLPNNLEDGRAMLQAISNRVYGSSEAGHAVTQALVEFLEELIPLHIFEGIVPSYIRFFVGDAVADMLNVPPSNFMKAAIVVAQAEHELEHAILHDSQMFSRITDTFGRALIEGMERYENKDGRPAFYVPDILRKNWGLQPVAPVTAT